MFSTTITGKQRKRHGLEFDCMDAFQVQFVRIPRMDLSVYHPAKTSKNTCNFWDIRRFRLGFTMVVYEKIDLEA